MEYDNINNFLLSEDNESEVSRANRANEISEKLSKFVTREYVKVIVYLIRITKINQLNLKLPC